MDKATRAAIDEILILCDRGNMAMDEYREWREENPASPLTDCFSWILQGDLSGYNEGLCADKQIEKDVANPQAAFFADSMDIYTLDVTIIGSALTQLIDEGTIDPEAKPYVNIGLRRQAHASIGILGSKTIQRIQKAVDAA